MSKTKTERQKVRDDHPDSWIAVEEGDSILGKIVDVTDAWSDQRRNPETGRPGSSYPLLTINAKEARGYTGLPKELKVHGFGAVLFNEIMRKQPGIGEEVLIIYRGSGEAKPGQNPPELYTLRAAAGTDVARRAYDAIPTPAPQRGSGQSVQPELSAGADDDIPF